MVFFVVVCEAMMVPNRETIMKVKLASVGYSGFELLGKKFCILYALCEQQLSKQRLGKNSQFWQNGRWVKRKHWSSGNRLG